MVDSSFEIFKALKRLGHIKEQRDELWWPNSGSFEVLIGAILTQNTNWNNVEKALKNLRDRDLTTLDKICDIEISHLAELIRSSGFYNQKSKRIKALAQNIKDEFGTFEGFCQNTTREWILSQKGVGEESADSILCYGALRDEMICDSYTHRLLSALGIYIDEYCEIKRWIEAGIKENHSNICDIYQKSVSLNYIYARFHGKIVEFCKENSKGKTVDISTLELI